MALDADDDAVNNGEDREAKGLLQSSPPAAKPIKVIADHGVPDKLSRTNGVSSDAANNNQESIPLRKMEKSAAVDDASSDRMYGKPPLVRADSRAFGVSHIFDRVTRFVAQGPQARRSDAFSQDMDDGGPIYRTTPRRWIMLLVFALYSMSNSFQWIEYGIILDKITFFYSVDDYTVDWLSMIYMLTYIPLVFPATWLLDKKGLRIVALIGSFGNFIGAALKCFSAVPDRFWVTFIGQTISAISQIFILGLPARLAAVWFGASEVAFATAVGCFGNQVRETFIKDHLYLVDSSFFLLVE